MTTHPFLLTGYFTMQIFMIFATGYARKTSHYLRWLLLYTTLIHVPRAIAQPQEYVVTQGAFVLREYDTFDYLPVGTVIRMVDAKIRKIYASARNKNESYRRVQSEHGTTGLVRQGLYEELKERIIMAVGAREVPVYRVDSTEDELKPLAKYSRATIGKWVVVTQDEEKNPFLRVELNWPKERTPRDKGLFYRKLFDRKIAKSIKPGSISFFNVETITLSDVYDTFINQSFPNLDLSRKAREAAVNALESLSCNVSIDTSISTGFELFGNGIRARLQYDLKEKGVVYQISGFRIGRKKFLFVKRILCEGSGFDRLESIAALSLDSDLKSIQFKFKDLPQHVQKRWSSAGLARKYRTRMVRIEGFNDYHEVWKFLNRQAEASSFRDSTHRDALLVFLIREASYFTGQLDNIHQ